MQFLQHFQLAYLHVLLKQMLQLMLEQQLEEGVTPWQNPSLMCKAFIKVLL